MRKTELDKFRDSQKEGQPSQTVSFEEFPRLLLGGAPLPTQKRFIWGEERIRFFKGPAGSAKTTSMAAICFMRALFQPGARIGVSRYDYNDLLTTTAVEFEKMLHRLPAGTLLARDKQAPMRWWIRPAIPDGEPSILTFQGLKDRIVGSNMHGWAIDEVDEVEKARVQEIDMRLRAEGSSAYFLVGAFNPPDRHHWLYEACTGRDHRDRVVAQPWVTLYEPIPGENNANLPDKFYETRAVGKPEDYIRRYILGEWGQTFDGAPVYREFNERIHTRAHLEYDPGTPLLRGWDFGYNHPFCIWAQVDGFGRLRVLREEMGHMEEATPFARRMLALTAQHFHQILELSDYGDPAVRQHKDTGSTLAEFYKLGIAIRFKTGQKLMDGVDFLRRTFTELADGEPRVLIDSTQCPILVSALKGGYHLDRLGREPVKDGFYDHGADDLRYLATAALQGTATMPDTSRLIPDSLEYDSALDQRGYARPESISYEAFDKWLRGSNPDGQ